MKILYILDSLNRGGTEILALDIARNAAKHGLDISFVTMQGGSLEKDFHATGCKIYYVTRKLPFDLRTVWQLRKIIHKEKIDIIHSHQVVSIIHTYFAAIGTKVRNILSWHGSVNSVKKKQILRFVSKKINANIAVSKEFKNRIEKEIHINTDKFHVVYNGVDPTKLNGYKGLLRKELEISDEVLVFGMVGNFYSEAKDQYTVCKALPKFFQEISNAKFIFVGNRLQEEAYLFDRCVEFCTTSNLLDKVIFLQGRSDISTILADLNCFVFSSVSDTFGIAVVEAMLSGVPCICSDIGPLLEVTDNGKYALLFKTGNESDLSEAMIKMAQNPTLRQELSLKSQKWALKKFTIDEHIRELKKIYKEISMN